jgi:hypothetical protein
MQRVDDVTGETIRLTAHQKELRVEGMIARINELTRQVNHLTTQHQVLIEKHNALAERLDREQVIDRVYLHHRFLTNAPLFTRFRWLLTGR